MNSEPQSHVGTSCPNCGVDGSLPVFYRLESIPVHSCLLMPTPEEALAHPKGELALASCGECGFIFNHLFDLSLLNYSATYEETQGFSPTFNAFARELAQTWVDRYNLRGKRIVEIGCGKGEFLSLLCDLGGNHGVGFDPAYVPGRTPCQSGRVEFIQDDYSEQYSGAQADFVCCRHTLEHIPSPRQFIEMVRRTLGDTTDTIVGFELPDTSRILRETAFWDIYYEHCSYFTMESLGRLFTSTGFEVLDLRRAYGDQYLVVEARPGPPPAESETPETAPPSEQLRKFRHDVQPTIQEWKARLERWSTANRRVVLWGSGSKAVGFLTTLKVGDQVAAVVDINPYKSGRYMPGCRQPIVPPQSLRDDPPDVIIVMNPIYEEEIRQTLSGLRVSSELTTL